MDRSRRFYPEKHTKEGSRSKDIGPIGPIGTIGFRGPIGTIGFIGFIGSIGCRIPYIRIIAINHP